MDVSVSMDVSVCVYSFIFTGFSSECQSLDGDITVWKNNADLSVGHAVTKQSRL